NRRNNMDTIFDLLIKRMVGSEPKRLIRKLKNTAT
ncbi:MAG: IS1595 family transposase, partial [Dysgonamonadaceae bacterium]|nr:IS1595 family transposase [Dysgonamonadaceae bacterium]